MAKIIEITVDLEKGDGRRGLLNRVDMALIMEWFRPKPGRYLVTVQRIESDEEKSDG